MRRIVAQPVVVAAVVVMTTRNQKTSTVLVVAVPALTAVEAVERAPQQLNL